MRSKWRKWLPGYEYNEKTGETRISDKQEKGFAMVKHAASIKICADRSIWGTPRAILDYMIGHYYKGECYVIHKNIAKLLKISEPSVSRNIKKLVAQGYIKQGKKLGKHIPYSFSEDFIKKPARTTEEHKLDHKKIKKAFELEASRVVH